MNKAEKSQIIVPVICFVCVFLSAVLIWSYYSKPADEDGTLSVTIKYPEYETAVITPVSTMECAIDNKFLHELQKFQKVPMEIQMNIFIIINMTHCLIKFI